MPSNPSCQRTIMADSSSSDAPVKFSSGGVVMAGLRIYRDHLTPYYWQAFQSYLWIALAAVITVVTILGVDALSLVLDQNTVEGLMILALLGLLIPWGYCLAKSIAVQGVLARVAFFEVGEQPESLEAARIQLMPRFWRFLWASLLAGLVALLALLIVVGIFVLLVVISSILSLTNSPGAMLWGGLALLWFFVGLFMFVWIFSRLALTDVCLAIEPTLSPVDALGRSWALTKGHVLSLQIIFSIVFVITLPIVIASNFGSIVAFFMGLEDNVGNIINFPFAMVFGSLLIPIWQAIKAVVYFDLRTRKEGLKLSLDLPLMDDF